MRLTGLWEIHSPVNLMIVGGWTGGVGLVGGVAGVGWATGGGGDGVGYWRVAFEGNVPV